MQEPVLLTEFNPALMYAFEPEGSPAQFMGSTTLEDCFFPLVGQHRDVLNAYLYAQNHILPICRQQAVQPITVPQFLGWIKQLHAYIGKTLLSCFNAEAGQYSTEPILRWHQGSMMNQHLLVYFADKHQCKTDNDFVKFLCTEQGGNEREFSEFIALIRKVNKIPDVLLREDFKANLRKQSIIPPEQSHIKGLMILSKLYSLRSMNLLSAAENIIVDKIVKITMEPSKISAAMSDYAAKTLHQMQQMQGCQDLDQIAAFVAESFYQLADIHPFPNANGRVATCLMNIMLRCFNLPSILLRHPGDKSDESSAYSIAIQTIDQSRLALQQLIKKRILAAKIAPFVDLTLEKTITLRIALVDILERIKCRHPSYNLKVSQEDAMEVYFSQQNKDDDSQQMDVTVLLKIWIDMAIQLEKKLDSQLAPIFSLSTRLTTEKKEHLVANLEKLSGCSGWKTNESRGLVVWIEQADKLTATIILEKLQAAGIGKTSLMSRADKKQISVVKCEGINIQKLMQQVALLPSEDAAELSSAAACSASAAKS